MDIAFFGSSLVSAYWNGAATYYRGLIRALHDRGHKVTFYEPDAFERQQHRDIEDPAWARVVVYPATEDAMRRALHQARGADLIIKASGVGVFDEALEAAVAHARTAAAARSGPLGRQHLPMTSCVLGLASTGRGPIPARASAGEDARA